MAVQRMYTASQVQESKRGGLGASGDLLGSTSDLPSLVVQSGGTDSSGDGLLSSGKSKGAKIEGAFDAIIAIGVLIKGETVHFEHIAETVSRGLMRVQLDFGVPVIFGLLVSCECEDDVEGLPLLTNVI